MPAIAVRFDPIRSLGFAGITSSYAVLGGPFTHNMRILHIVNATNADIIISFNGTADNIYVVAGSFVLYDMQANSENGTDFFFSLLTQLYVRAASGSPSSGSVYVTTVYGAGQ